MPIRNASGCSRETRAVIEALERKVQYAGFYRRNYSNVEMATL